jgi:hypothetical protein
MHRQEIAMKTIAAIIAGLLLSLMTFMGGLLTSSIYFDVDKGHHHLDGRDVTALWTSEPVAVDRDRQPLERLPARPVPEMRQVAAVGKITTGQAPKEATSDARTAADDPQPMVDPVTTAAVDPDQSKSAAVDPDQSGPQAGQNTAHIAWCSRHYRSYRAADNTYRSYSGDLRTCESPYSNLAATDPKPGTDRNVIREAEQRPDDNVGADDSGARVEQASFKKTAGDDAGSDHVQSCLRRYRSYRVEDNSYQPFDGGPRRQCQ